MPDEFTRWTVSVPRDPGHAVMRLVVGTNALVSDRLPASSMPAQLLVLWRAGRF